MSAIYIVCHTCTAGFGTENEQCMDSSAALQIEIAVILRILYLTPTNQSFPEPPWLLCLPLQTVLSVLACGCYLFLRLSMTSLIRNLSLSRHHGTNVCCRQV